MPVLISLLRAVNVGGHHNIRMDALREVYESLGLKDVKSYVQSGNIVFRTDARDIPRLAKRIEAAIEDAFGFRPDVIVRSTPEMRDTIAQNPFAGRSGIEPSKLAVVFMPADPGAGAREKIARLSAAGYPEELFLDGRQLYIYFTIGMARPKLTAAQIDKALKTPGTARNWNTVNKLLAIAEEMEASEPRP